MFPFLIIYTMKKPILCTLLCLSATFFLLSCTKEVAQSEVIKEIILDTTIRQGTAFHLDLSTVWNATKKVTIIEQATHFTISEIEPQEGNTSPSYLYTSSLQSGGTDRVTIAISDLDDGKRTVSKDSTIIYVNFTVR